MLIAILVLLLLSGACLVTSGVYAVLCAVNARHANTLNTELRGYWDVRAITFQNGSEIIHSPRAQTRETQGVLDARLAEWRTANERVRGHAKLAKDWLLCAFCLAGIAGLYIWKYSRGGF